MDPNCDSAAVDAGDGKARSATAHDRARVSFERLRERTDELELLISGLALFALIALPGWMWERFEELYARMPLELAAAVTVLMPVLSGICYVMAALFLAHLAVRAHWVGLIGLKAVCPEGVRWERLQAIGPITLARLRARLPDLDRGIARADMIASTLFSLITFTALAVAILGAWMTALFLVGSLYGNVLGGANRFINIALIVLFVAFVVAPLLRWLLDGVLARRVPALRDHRAWRGIVHFVGWIERLFMPTRLVGATRLVLQSQLLPRSFFALFVLAVLVIASASNGWFQGNRGFDVFGSQRYVTGQDLLAAHRSRHYESQRLPRDRPRPVPMIPAPVIEQPWLPLLLPYVALIDDPLLRGRCAERAAPQPFVFEFDASDSDAAAEAREATFQAATESASACLRKLWEVRLDGSVQSLDAFVVSERADLGLRGLTGYLPLSDLAHGPHRLEVIWRPRPEQDKIVEDYVPRRIRYVIPFVWAPEVDAPAGVPVAPD